MLRKILSSFLLVGLALCLCTSALADVIWEPMEVDYYKKHSGDFFHDGDVYYVNSPTGKLQLRDEPNGKVLKEVENGLLYRVEWICTTKKGENWGLVEQWTEPDGQSFFVPMDSMLKQYNVEFFDDHRAELLDTCPEGVETTWDGDCLVWWSYPGGVPTRTDNWYADEDYSDWIRTYYVDADGNVWGYIGYWYGHRDSWVCLSDMDNKELAKPEIYTGPVYFGPNALPLEEAKPEKTGSLGVMTVALPLCAVGISAALLLLWPKKQKQTEKG